MPEVGIHEAKTHFSKLLRRVSSGEEIVITRSGRPVARLVGIASAPDRSLGRDRGIFEVPEDFDEALPADLLAEFER